uniref:Putative secreted protein n=1 Tax=Anopheles darlingi TaxID=43151 RepID=A0A2M4DM66_ANODA
MDGVGDSITVLLCGVVVVWGVGRVLCVTSITRFVAGPPESAAVCVCVCVRAMTTPPTTGDDHHPLVYSSAAFYSPTMMTDHYSG